MGKRFVGPMVVTLAAIVAAGSWLPTQAQSQPAGHGVRRLKDGRPDLNGIWQAIGEAHWDIRTHQARQGPVMALGAAFSIPAGLGVVEGDEIPYQPWAAAKQRDNQENWLTRDPEIKCYLPGVPRATYLPYPFQIIQGSREILIAYAFANATRVLHMNSKEESASENWMGWSRAHWQGDTLVVDVTAFTDQTWFDRAGNFHSSELHVVERYTPVSADVLRYEATIEDPKVFTRSWKLSLPLYRRQEKNIELLEYQCIPFVEELMYGHLYKRHSK